MNNSCERFLGLGSSRFSRRYSGNKRLFFVPPLTRMFYFSGFALACASHCGLHNGVPPFGNPRIAGCYAPSRGVSPLRCVLRRLLMSRHPPFALIANHPNTDFHHLASGENADQRGFLRRCTRIRFCYPRASAF